MKKKSESISQTKQKIVKIFWKNPNFVYTSLISMYIATYVRSTLAYLTHTQYQSLKTTNPFSIKMDSPILDCLKLNVDIAMKEDLVCLVIIVWDHNAYCVASHTNLISGCNL